MNDFLPLVEEIFLAQNQAINNGWFIVCCCYDYFITKADEAAVNAEMMSNQKWKKK